MKNNTENILEGLHKALNTSNTAELANKLGYSRASIYKWIKEDSLPVDRILRKFPELDRKFLETGEGEPIANQKLANNLERLWRENEYLIKKGAGHRTIEFGGPDDGSVVRESQESYASDIETGLQKRIDQLESTVRLLTETVLELKRKNNS